MSAWALWASRMRPTVIAQANDLLERAAALRRTGEEILPPQELILRALDLTPPDRVRCVILGQDPYPTPGMADGLAFSASGGKKIPASLRNIFRELSADLDCPMPSSPDLTPWALQGVLLLNATLTVRSGAPGSHAKWGWSVVTEEILRVCEETLSQPIVYLLWGAHARRVAAAVGAGTHPRKQTFCSSHPSPLGASKGRDSIPAFLGSRPFSRANQFLASLSVPPINWHLL